MSEEIIQNENLEVSTQEEQVETTVAPVEETAVVEDVAVETVAVTAEEVAKEIVTDSNDGEFYVYTKDMNIHSFHRNEQTALKTAEEIGGSYRAI